MLQLAVDGEDVYTDVAFVQEAAVQKEDPARRVAITMLKKSGRNLKSQLISLLAMRLAADPFAKVKDLIQQLIERLLSESSDEATKKGWCDTNMAKQENARQARKQ